MQINDVIPLKKDQYQLIEEQLGGAQAHVFKVRRVSDQQILALKVARIWKKSDVLWPISRVNANCTRIQQEIEFLQSLEDAETYYIVACLDADTLKQGGKNVPVFVMPFYDQPLSRALLDEQQPSLKRHLKWIQQLIIALKYIHHHKKNGDAVLHRDLKLDNVMLTENDEIRLLDFGISKQVIKTTDSTHTKMNYSDDCVAPEQILLIKPNTDGKKHVAIGTHTDIYALGLLIYRLIAGHLPESHEAFIMNLDEIGQQHKTALDKGEKGLLGTIGGITSEETAFLAQSFIDLAEGTPVTFFDDDDDDDDDDDEFEDTHSPYQALAERFAEFVAELVDKRYQDRPNAKNALHWVENIQYKLSALDVSVAKEAVKEVVIKPVIQTDNDTTVIMPRVKKPQPTLPPTRPQSESPKKNQPATVLTEQQTEPKREKTQNDLPIIPVQLRQWSFKKILLVAGVVLLLINAWLLLRSKPEPVVLPEPDSPVINKQNTGRSDTTRSLGDNQQKWTDVIPKLKRLIKTGDTKQQADALALLAHAYQYGKGVTANWGKAWTYYQAAQQKNRNSTVQQQQESLEMKANTILTNLNSPAVQRKKAYQVIEMVANQRILPLSINARLWMEYRYRTGDGVAANPVRADAWKQKYNDIKDQAQ